MAYLNRDAARGLDTARGLAHDLGKAQAACGCVLQLWV